jgi:hypothetical protein
VGADFVQGLTDDTVGTVVPLKFLEVCPDPGLFLDWELKGLQSGVKGGAAAQCVAGVCARALLRRQGVASLLQLLPQRPGRDTLGCSTEFRRASIAMVPSGQRGEVCALGCVGRRGAALED